MKNIQIVKKPMSEAIKYFTEFTRERNNVEPRASNLLYTVTGMLCEAGEAGDVIKKHCRGDKVDLREFVLECGDALYYMTQTLDSIGYTLEDVMEWNQKKLDLRDEHGKSIGNELLKQWLESK